MILRHACCKFNHISVSSIKETCALVNKYLVAQTRETQEIAITNRRTRHIHWTKNILHIGSNSCLHNMDNEGADADCLVSGKPKRRTYVSILVLCCWSNCALRTPGPCCSLNTHIFLRLIVHAFFFESLCMKCFNAWH